MPNDPQLNGSDYLMLGFDRELRRQGYAGNLCQILLKLDAGFAPGLLEQRLATLWTRHPLLSVRPAGRLIPRWKPRCAARPPRIRLHRDAPDLQQRLLNDALDTSDNELMRFDVIAHSTGGMDLVFTWSHVLMDGVGAEHFLATLGGEESPILSTLVPPAGATGGAPLRLPERMKLAWKYLHYLDEFREAPPRSMENRLRQSPATLHYRVERFSREETARVRVNAGRLCGVLGDGQFHAAAATLELHRLHQRLGWISSSYVLPMPVSLRRKGGAEPIIGNQITMLMFQFRPDQLDSIDTAVASLKSQTTQAMRLGLIESGCMLSGMFRFLPLALYMSILKRGLNGEICSLFFGDTAAVNPRLNRFLGLPVRDFIHVAAVTPSPGLSVIYYYFADELRVTVVHSARSLTEAEAVEFAARLRERLLNP